MKNIIVVTCCIAIQLICVFKVNSQIIELKLAPATVVIDGSLSEWQIPYSDKKNTFSYLISNDRNNLYLIAKITDTVCQGNVLGAGISFTVIKNNSEVDAQLTFPQRGKEDPTAFMNLDKEQMEMKTILARYKRIAVQNFKDIEAKELTPTNPYGIKVALAYTDDGNLIYEEAIPLALLFPDGINEKCSYSIKINGLARKAFFLNDTEVVPVIRSPSTETAEDRLAKYIQVEFAGGDFKILGDIPIKGNDYEEKLTADTEVKGEFILAR